ncbi:MAG: RluA family pseudouridine synthase [Clostridiales bacterium]|jgi:23S rRNA pseudouridine1911/1915/1917 synthase|nr:RluA family pseudouridine synthase [Clostridiales bacterium]
MTRLICEEGGARLDVWLAANAEGLSRSFIQKLLAEGRVVVNGAPAAKNHRLKPGDEVLLFRPEPKPLDLLRQDIKLNIVFEDAHIIVVDKPRGMVVHPANGNPDGTLVNALLYHCADSLSDINGVVRPGIVHRLDKDTSGLIVAAKTNAAHQGLAADFKGRRVRKLYNAIARGHVAPDSGRIELPIGRHPTDRKRMAVLEGGGRAAVTLFRVVRRLPGPYTWLELEILTGRTHQIRVHLAHIGHPVAGDPVYGAARRAGRRPARASAVSLGADAADTRLACAAQADAHPACAAQDAAAPSERETSIADAIRFGQLLHATVLELNHPVTGERLTFKSPLPPYFHCSVGY